LERDYNLIGAISILETGIITVLHRAGDLAGNQSGTKSITLQMDTLAPEGSVTATFVLVALLIHRYSNKTSQDHEG
jgi:hypothetical protein